MRWGGKSKLDWHRWFAWYPVQIFETKVWVWLETVEKVSCGYNLGNRYKLKEPLPSHMQDSWENGI